MLPHIIKLQFINIAHSMKTMIGINFLCHNINKIDVYSIHKLFSMNTFILLIKFNELVELFCNQKPVQHRTL